LCGAGDFSALVFFFFFPFGDASFAGDFFAFGFGLASGVSLGVGEASDSSAGVFRAFAFGFGEGDGDDAFFFLCGEVLSFGVELGDSSGDGEFTARAFRIRVGFSWSVCCA
jgi:hypothetical protein